MSCYFMVCTYEKGNERASYDEYIQIVKPIVESFGGVYLVRSEKMIALSEQWNPDRIILIRFPNREQLDKCFQSDEYVKIKDKRLTTVDSQAIIVEGVENEDM